MNRRLRNELIEVIAGLVMIIIGVVLFLNKVTVVSEFLQGSDYWVTWKRLLCLVPLAAGIVLMIVRKDWIGSKIISGIGALLIIVLVIATTTLVLDTRIDIIEWIVFSALILGGVIIIVVALIMANRKKARDK